MTLRDRFWGWLAWHLPRGLVEWCAIRVFAAGTTGMWGDTVASDLSAIEAIRRWGDPAMEAIRRWGDPARTVEVDVERCDCRAQPPGWGRCTRAKGHDGPCAHPPPGAR